MRIVIHRGAHQIGGTCIEIATEHARIILDAGLPLDTNPLDPLPLPNVEGLWNPGDQKIDALFLTHAHADHSGLVSATLASIPVFCTKETSKILLAGSLFARQPKVDRVRVKILKAGEVRSFADLRITAFPVDHSTVGAAAFLVETDRHRVFYTGDLRFHGRRPEFAQRIEAALSQKPLDILLIEGTRLGERASEKNESEAHLLNRLETRCRSHRRPVFVSYSPLHVDRFLTFFDLATRLGRRFVIDPYQDFVLYLLQRDLLRPTRDGKLCTLLMPSESEPAALRFLQRSPWLSGMRKRALTREEVLPFLNDALVLYRPSMDSWLFPHGHPRDSLFLYSYWSGYLKQEAQKVWQKKVSESGSTLELAHASGHAHPDDLARFVQTVKPRQLIPVHTEHPDEWGTRYEQTRILADGDTLTLC
jgi:ribonuclease J